MGKALCICGLLSICRRKVSYSVRWLRRTRSHYTTSLGLLRPASFRNVLRKSQRSRLRRIRYQYAERPAVCPVRVRDSTGHRRCNCDEQQQNYHKHNEHL